MASFSLVAWAWKSTRVKVGFSPAFSRRSAVVKGLSLPQARSHRPMSTITATCTRPRS